MTLATLAMALRNPRRGLIRPRHSPSATPIGMWQEIGPGGPGGPGALGPPKTRPRSWNAPLYVRVNVASHYYLWWQTATAYHATVSVGYGGSGSSAMIGDPYTDAAHTNSCQPVAGYPGYSSTSDYGCIYYGGFPTYNYWMAMTDRIGGEEPEQY